MGPSPKEPKRTRKAPSKDKLAHYRDVCDDFMRGSIRDVTKRFASLPGAITINITDDIGQAVFIPGHREDRVLLVSHTDTVFEDDRGTDPVWEGPLGGIVARSANNKRGIGADDRAGCAALWLLRNSGHSLLLCPMEERGCLGSREVAALFLDGDLPELDNHRFAIQFDRRGSHDLVTYACCNDDFDKYLVSMMPGYEHASGSYSDISELCPALGIAGVNMSIGFRKEHTKSESLDLLDFSRTLETVSVLLACDCPAFAYVERVYRNWGFNTTKRKGKGKSKKGTSTRTQADDLDAADDYDDEAYMDWLKSRGGDPAQLGEPDYFWCDDCAVMVDPDEAVIAPNTGEAECPWCSNLLEPCHDLKTIHH